MTVITAALRTPIGKFEGALANIPAAELGAVVIRGLLDATGCSPDIVEEVIMGNILQSGQGQGPARQAAIKAGLPVTVPATTINMLCGSGLKAVNMAVALIESGQAEVVIAGGMENMSAAPYLLPGARRGQRLGHGKMIDSLLNDALVDAFDGCHMGITAERLASQYNITREAQDVFAAHSQQKAQAAISSNRFENEIIPVKLKNRKGEESLFSADEYPRPGVTPDRISHLAPAFQEGGTVTPANASGINDGAAAVMVMSDDKAKALGIEPMARILSCASTGVDPSVMGIGPVSAVTRAMTQCNLSLDQMDLMELNEAFAAQSLSVMGELKLDPDKVNVNGGAIALGHPVGASGARILVTLLHEMQKRGSEYGLASLCVGGGMGVATVVSSV